MGLTNRGSNKQLFWWKKANPETFFFENVKQNVESGPAKGTRAKRAFLVMNR